MDITPLGALIARDRTVTIVLSGPQSQKVLKHSGDQMMRGERYRPSYLLPDRKSSVTSNRNRRKSNRWCLSTRTFRWRRRCKTNHPTLPLQPMEPPLKLLVTLFRKVPLEVLVKHLSDVSKIYAVALQRYLTLTISLFTILKRVGGGSCLDIWFATSPLGNLHTDARLP